MGEVEDGGRGGRWGWVHLKQDPGGNCNTTNFFSERCKDAGSVWDPSSVTKTTLAQMHAFYLCMHEKVEGVGQKQKCKTGP